MAYGGLVHGDGDPSTWQSSGRDDDFSVSSPTWQPAAARHSMAARTEAHELEDGAGLGPRLILRQPEDLWLDRRLSRGGMRQRSRPGTRYAAGSLSAAGTDRESIPFLGEQRFHVHAVHRIRWCDAVLAFAHGC